MGDVFHTFPALSDAQKNLPGLVIDWVVESAFSEIPKWHPVVDQVYPIELRKWRKTLLSKQTRQEIKTFFETINQHQYDLIIDAQGLLKSAWVAKKVNAKIITGYDWQSAREPLATLFYQKKYTVAKEQHAILRLRQLIAQSLSYALPAQAPIVYGLNTQAWSKPSCLPIAFLEADYWVFLHGTTWETKYWPEDYWIALLQKAQEAGVKVVLPWGNQEEHDRAKKIANAVKNINIWVPQEVLSLNDVAKVLKNAQAVVSVDTGLSHVAAALDVPMVVLYRVTDPILVGADGPKVTRLESPCAAMYLKRFKNDEQAKQSLKGLSVDNVFETLLSKL